MNRSGPISNHEWKYWGKTDPLYGVLSDPRKRRGGAAPWETSEFFLVGEQHWRALWPQWQSYGVVSETCLEIGCGVGRMTRQLAKVFQRVTAIDVSEGMLQMAKSICALPNVEYHLTDGLNLPAPDASVSAVFSMHVLQHLRSREDQAECFRRMHGALKPGGSLLVHLPVCQFPLFGSKLRQCYELLYFKIRLVNRVKRALLRAGLNIPVMEFTEMPVPEVFRRLSGIGFREIEIRLVPTHDYTQIHPLVFARKPASRGAEAEPREPSTKSCVSPNSGDSL